MTKILAMIALLCLVFCLAIGLSTEPALAQDDMGTGGTKLGTKEFDKEKLPNKWEMAAGVGSLFVAYAVVKWL